MVTTMMDQVDRSAPRVGRRVTRARLMIVGAAGLVASVVALEYGVGVPPTDGNELLAWMDDHELGLILLDEALVFAGLAVAAAAAMARNAVGPDLRERLGATVGLAMLTTVLMFVTSLAGGRFVYPVHDLSVEEPDTAVLVTTLFYGGMHMVWLAFGATAIAVTVALRKRARAGLIATGVIAAIAAIIASYPEILGPEATLAVRLIFVGWMLILAAALPAAAADTHPGRDQPGSSQSARRHAATTG